MPNKNVGYGRVIADKFAPVSPSGRTFVVGAITLAGSGEAQRIFSADPFGKFRYYTSIAALIASARLSSSRGDTVYIMPGHTETIASATALVIATSGVQFIGCGAGNQRPTLQLTTATTATISVTGADVTFQNVIIDGINGGIDAIAAMVTGSAEGLTFLDCVFLVANATNQATLAISTLTVDHVTVKRCFFYGTNNAGTTAALQIVGGNEHVIEDNFFEGAYTAGVGAISNITTACLRTRVVGNQINNLTASSTKAMTFVSTSTGMITRNSMQILSGTAPITGAAMSWVGGNYYAATIATAGTLI